MWKRDEPGRFPAIVLAVIVHLLFFGLLIFGVTWKNKEPEAVTVDLWNNLPPAPKTSHVPTPRPHPQPENRQRAAAAGHQLAGKLIDQRRLAGAVGADDGVNFARLNVEVEVIRGTDAAE